MKTALTAEQQLRLYELGIKDVSSLQDILAILPKKITDRQKIYELKMWVDHYSDHWCIEYFHDSVCGDLEDFFVSAEKMIDAVFQGIVWLKQQENIKGL